MTKCDSTGRCGTSIVSPFIICRAVVAVGLPVVLLTALVLSGCEPAPGALPDVDDKQPTLPDIRERIAFNTNTAIAPWVLPAGTGGDGRLTYRLAPDVPGLRFDAGTRTLNGTPTTDGEYAMTYTATDADGDTATAKFTTAVISLSDGSYLRRVLNGADGGSITAAGVQALERFDHATIAAVLDADLSKPLSELVRTTPAVGDVLKALAAVYDTWFPAVSVELPRSSSLNAASAISATDTGAVARIVFTLRAVAATVLGIHAGSLLAAADCTFEAIDVAEIWEAITADGSLADTQRRLAACLETFRRHSPILRVVAAEHDLSATDDDRRNRETVTAQGFTRIHNDIKLVAEESRELVSASPLVDSIPGFEDVSVQALRKKLSQAEYVVNHSRVDLQLPAATGGDLPLNYRLTPDVPGLQAFITTPQTVACRRAELASCRPSGTLVGTPTAAGVYQMTYQVTDADGDTDQFTFTLIVNEPADQNLAFDSMVDTQAYDQYVAIAPLELPEATGGTAPLRYSLEARFLTPFGESSRDAPPGLRFDSNTRTLSGTPTIVVSGANAPVLSSPSSIYKMNYTATDAAGDTATLSFGIGVLAPTRLQVVHKIIATPRDLEDLDRDKPECNQPPVKVEMREIDYALIDSEEATRRYYIKTDQLESFLRDMNAWCNTVGSGGCEEHSHTSNPDDDNLSVSDSFVRGSGVQSVAHNCSALAIATGRKQWSRTGRCAVGHGHSHDLFEAEERALRKCEGRLGSPEGCRVVESSCLAQGRVPSP